MHTHWGAAWVRGTTGRAAPGRVEPQRLGLARRAEGEEASHEVIGISNRAALLHAALFLPAAALLPAAVAAAVRRRGRRGDSCGLSGNQPVACTSRGEECHGRWALVATAPLAALASAGLASVAQQLSPHSLLRATIHARRDERAPARPRRAAHRGQRLGRRRRGVRSDARQPWAHGLQAEGCRLRRGSQPTSKDAETQPTNLTCC